MILWLHKFGIYSRLYFLGGMTALMALLLGGIYIYGEHQNEDALTRQEGLVEAAARLHRVTGAFEILHHHQSEYFKAPDESRSFAFESSAERLENLIRKLAQSSLFEFAKGPIGDLQTSLFRYQNAFHRTVVLKKEVGLDENRGLQGAYHKEIRKIKRILAEIKAPELRNRILMLRQNEMEYRISGAERYISGFTNKYRDVVGQTLHPGISSEKWHELLAILHRYQDNFLSWVNADRQMKRAILEVNGQKKAFLSALMQIKDISSKKLQQTNALQRETREYSRQVILISLALATLVMLFLSTMVAASLSRPIKYLSWVMKGLARGETYHDVPYYSLDNELGEMARAVNVFKTGIIARIKAEAELRKTAERYNLAIKGANSGIWDWDVMARKSHYSESFMEVLGFAGEERVTHDSLLLDRICPDHKKIYLDSIRKNLLKGEHRIDIEIKIRHAKGKDIWIQVIGWAVDEDDEGWVTRAVGKITDITKLKETELELRAHKVNLEKTVAERTRELQESQNTLTEAINAIPEGFILSDTEDKVILVNDLMKEYYPAAAPVMHAGTYIRDMIRASFPEESEEKIDRRMRDYSNARSGEIRRLESGVWLHIVRKKIPGLGVIALYNDVTTFRQQEDELTEQAAKLELALSSERELGELQRSFVSMASHEFRTPLAIIDGIAHRLSRRAGKRRLDPDDVLNRVTQIRSSVKRMVNLMESTLSAARMDAGKVSIKPRDCDLRAVIEEVCERQRGISPSHNITTDLEAMPASIRGDSASLEQVFTNLLSNAVKYAPNNPDIEIRAWQSADDVLVSFRDHGLGIDEDDLPKMFGRFFRAKTSTGIAGTGIGLNLVKMFVEEHGGRVTVESRIGKGSTFTVRLPIAGPQLEDEYDDNQDDAEEAA